MEGSRLNEESLAMEEIHANLLDQYHRSTREIPFQRSSTNTLEDESNEKLHVDDEYFLSETPNTVARELELSLQANDKAQDKRIYCSQRMNRSESLDRRLNEAAQFCAAVGEIPPTKRSELQHIIDSEGEDEFDGSSDDDASNNVPIQQQHSSSETRRPRWPFARKRCSFFHCLPGEVRPHDFSYHGIQSNPPEITHRGVARGNYAQLHRKAWLEVSDQQHRYGKNLRLYYRHWESLGFPTNNFFDWLDSKGDAAGRPLPELEECPREQLDSDTVLYITDFEVTKGYALTIECYDGRAIILDADGERVVTGDEGWIFVLRDNVLYGARKITSVNGNTKQRFHHSSFFGGKAVAAAGILITNEQGVLTKLFPHSGHYRPGDADMQRMLFFLFNEGVDLRTLEIDTQQLIHVCRDKKGEKKKKLDSLHLMPAVIVAHQLSHKARCIGGGIFAEIHKLRVDESDV